MRFIMSALEPVSLSFLDTRALVPSGKREIDCALGCQIIEFMTEQGEDTHIKGPMRTTATLLENLKAKNVEGGRPARELLLPPDWDIDGHYNIANHTKSSLKLIKRIGVVSECIVEPKGFGMKAGEEFLNVCLAYNHSRTRAEIVDQSLSKAVNCNTLLQRHVVDKSRKRITAKAPEKTKVEPRKDSHKKKTNELAEIPPPEGEDR